VRGRRRGRHRRHDLKIGCNLHGRGLVRRWRKAVRWTTPRGEHGCTVAGETKMNEKGISVNSMFS
jgi:hypothetical protein